MSARRRLGLFGGTFDPIHVAHLHIAACALHELALDEVRFIPAGNPPHKPGRRISDAAERVHMLELAIAGVDDFVIDSIDLRGDEPSYTSELLERISAADPDAELWFIVGGDSLAELHTWHQPERVIQLARLAVAARPGRDVDEALATSAVPGLRARVDVVATAPIDLSATLIRERLAAGLPIDWLVPDPVLRYINDHRLYAPPDERD